MTRVQALRQAQANLHKKAARRLADRIERSLDGLTITAIPMEVFWQMLDAQPTAEDVHVKLPTLN